MSTDSEFPVLILSGPYKNLIGFLSYDVEGFEWIIVHNGENWVEFVVDETCIKYIPYI